jgi:hypothetical protein
MCFAPQISLLTAVVEWVLVAIVLLKFRRSLVARFVAVFIFVLGLYQFTEFMLCRTALTSLWAQIGFLTYTFLPAMGLHFMLRLVDRKSKLAWCYILPVTFSILSIVSKGFVLGSACHQFFVSTQLMFFNPVAHRIIMSIYSMYYFGFIVIASMIASKAIMAEKEKIKKKIMIFGLAAVWVATLPAFVFVIILSQFAIQFPSVYCEFALLMAIAGFFIAEWDAKYRLYEKINDEARKKK